MQKPREIKVTDMSDECFCLCSYMAIDIAFLPIYETGMKYSGADSKTDSKTDR